FRAIRCLALNRKRVRRSVSCPTWFLKLGIGDRSQSRNVRNEIRLDVAGMRRMGSQDRHPQQSRRQSMIRAWHCRILPKYLSPPEFPGVCLRLEVSPVPNPWITILRAWVARSGGTTEADG